MQNYKKQLSFFNNLRLRQARLDPTMRCIEIQQPDLRPPGPEFDSLGKLEGTYCTEADFQSLQSKLTEHLEMCKKKIQEYRQNSKQESMVEWKKKMISWWWTNPRMFYYHLGRKTAKTLPILSVHHPETKVVTSEPNIVRNVVRAYCQKVDVSRRPRTTGGPNPPAIEDRTIDHRPK